MIVLRVIKRLIWDLWVAVYVMFFGLREKARYSTSEAQTLADFGFHRYKQLMQESDIQLLLSVYGDHLRSVKVDTSGQANGRISKNGLLDHRLDPIKEAFEEIATDYLGRTAQIDLSYFQASVPVPGLDDVPGGSFHIDHYKPTLKFFVYLSDVTEDRGPFALVPQSHRWNEFSRLFVAFDYALTKSRRSLYVGKRRENELLRKETAIVGERGTMFVADTSCWHRAHQVAECKRLVFVIGFR